MLSLEDLLPRQVLLRAPARPLTLRFKAGLAGVPSAPLLSVLIYYGKILLSKIFAIGAVRAFADAAHGLGDVHGGPPWGSWRQQPSPPLPGKFILVFRFKQPLEFLQ